MGRGLWRSAEPADPALAAHLRSRRQAAQRAVDRAVLKEARAQQKAVALEEKRRKAAVKKAAQQAAKECKASLKRARSEAAATRKERGITSKKEKQQESDSIKAMMPEDFLCCYS